MKFISPQEETLKNEVIMPSESMSANHSGTESSGRRKIPSKKTRYDDVVFRSKLEAQWAVFMNSLKVNWEYEPKQYDLGAVKYTPDFWLPDNNIFLEIKPPNVQFPLTFVELHKAAMLSYKQRCEVYIMQCFLTEGSPNENYRFTPQDKPEMAHFTCGHKWVKVDGKYTLRPASESYYSDPILHIATNSAKEHRFYA